MDGKPSESGRPPLRFSKRIRAAKWSPNGTYLALALAGNIVSITDGVTQVGTLSAEATGLKFSPCEKFIGVIGRQELSIWDVAREIKVEQRSFTDEISDFEWSPSGKLLAVAFITGAVEIIDRETVSTVSGSDWHLRPAILSWSVGAGLVSASADALIFWDGEPGGSPNGFGEFNDNFEDIEFDLEADYSTYAEGEIHSLGHDPHGDFRVNSIVPVSGGRVATAGNDGTLRVWTREGTAEKIYENASADIFCALSSTSSGDYIATLESDGTVQVIDVRTLTLFGSVAAEVSTTLPEGFPGIQPGRFNLAIANETMDAISFHDLATLMEIGKIGSSSHYRNAKVVLVGDSGVGKSGLALSLSGKDFIPTESTHARNVWTLGSEAISDEDTRGEAREVLLWDLAGQPGYRLFHRLSLRDVAIGLIVFDSRSESDPFRGVSYWAKALDEASPNSEMVKILVSARSDRGGISVSAERIAEFTSRYSIDSFHETSAKSGIGIVELMREIKDRIRWDSLPIVATPSIFMEIRNFLISQKNSGFLLLSQSEIEERFTSARAGIDITREMFEVCLGRLEATGLIARISFGDRWLLQPELLDSYVASLAHSARHEPDGLGAIDEGRALRGDYEHDALPSTTDEQAMLVTAVEEVVGRGLALRVPTDNGQMVVFPSELRADLPDYPEGYTLEVVFKFEGAIAAIYATVAVRLINSLWFGSDYRLFKNAAIFGYETEALCGFAVHYPPGGDDTIGRIVVFFGPTASGERKLAFLRYIDYQLNKLSISESVVRERIYTCYQCKYQIPPDVVALRRNLGHETLICPVCAVHMPTDTLAQDASIKDARTAHLVRQAVHEQAKQQRLAGYSLRAEMQQYHVFICYNSVDRGMVRRLDQQLVDQGVITWVDFDKVAPGDEHTRRIEEVIDEVPCAIVAIGPNSIGPWQEQEYYALLAEAVSRRRKGAQLRIIPVLLPGSIEIDEFPPFLSVHSVVDMRGHDSGGNRLRKLVDAILMPVRVQA